MPATTDRRLDPRMVATLAMSAAIELENSGHWEAAGRVRDAVEVIEELRTQIIRAENVIDRIGDQTRDYVTATLKRKT